MNKKYYLNENSYRKIQELHEVDLSIAVITGIISIILGGILKGIDYLLSGDKINFKNKKRAIQKIFNRKEIPKEFDIVINNYNKNKFSKIGILGVWKDMSFSPKLLEYPSIFMTIPLRKDLDLDDSDIIVAKPKGNSKSYFILNSNNKIDLVTKVSRVKKFDSYKEMLDKYYKITNINDF